MSLTGARVENLCPHPLQLLLGEGGVTLSVHMCGIHVTRMQVLCSHVSLASLLLPHPVTSPLCTCTARGPCLSHQLLGSHASSEGFTDRQLEFDRIQLFSYLEPVDITEESYKYTEHARRSRECCW